MSALWLILIIFYYFIANSIEQKQHSNGYYHYGTNGLSFCATRPLNQRCCASRDDNCTAPIQVRSYESPDLLITHLCYCDYFCNRDFLNAGNDCCPDFNALCKNGKLAVENDNLQLDLTESEFGSGEEEIQTQQGPTNDNGK